MTTTMRRTAAYYGEEGQYPQKGTIVRRGPHRTDDRRSGASGVYSFHADGDPDCEYTHATDWRDATDHCEGHYNPPHPLQAAINKYDNYKGRRNHVPIMNNTWIHKDDQGNFHIQHHNTNILSVAPNGDTTINPDGWHSPTTMKRLHQFLPNGTRMGKNPSRAQGAPERTFNYRPGGGHIWGSGEERGRFGLHPETQTHTYEDGFSFNAHSGQVLPDDHVRPTSDPVRPPQARGTDTSRGPGSYERLPSRYRNNPGPAWGSPARSVPYVPPTPMHEQESTHEQIHQQLRDVDQHHPGHDDYGDDGEEMGFSHHDLPAEGESFDDWMERTTDKPKNVPCGDCKGRGTVRAKGPVPEGVNPWEHKETCSTCGGDGLVKNSRITREGSLLNEGVLWDRWVAGLKIVAYQTIAYGEVKAPDQVDTLREENCPVCGETDAYDGDQCQVCGFVTPPEMFRDPDLSKAKMMDLRTDPASGDDNVQHDLAPVDPDAVDDEGNVDGNAEGDEGAVEGEEAGSPETQDDGDGIVDVETRGLGDEGSEIGQPGAEDEQDPDAPVDPKDLNDDGEVSPGEEQVAEEQAQVDDDAEEVKAQEAVEDGENVSAPVDPEAATGHFDQGGEPFTPGPNALNSEQPVEPGSLEGQEQAEDGQEEIQPNQVPGEPGDGIADLLCPSCGFEAGAATPISTPGSNTVPANEGDGMMAGDVCPQCQGATLMSTGEIQELTGAPK